MEGEVATHEGADFGDGADWVNRECLMADPSMCRYMYCNALS
ncbi:MAG: hypothetical protein Q8P22_11685 [Chloroflexota bacterium]|nr:hypothetical protein [Chloroflexota bacterium]